VFDRLVGLRYRLCPLGGFGPGLSERLVPMHLSTMGPRSAIRQDSRAAGSSPGVSRKSFPALATVPARAWNHSQLIGRRKAPLRIRLADWLLAHLDSKWVFFGLLVANAVVVVTLTLFVFGYH
jgi:hypothetical protein